MDDFVRTRLRPLAPGILFAMLAIAFGFGLGSTGAAKESLAWLALPAGFRRA